MKRTRAEKTEDRKRRIAILDMETDPFDKARPNAKVFPFLAVLYSDRFETIVIWEEDFATLVKKVVAAINGLPEPFTIYAHNGGRFDYMFLVSEMRGDVKFKGAGIMSARIGLHELRDSFHIIPERLAAFHKETFDYEWMKKKRRRIHKQAIIDYCISDCRYLLEIVTRFIGQFGLKLSIGQAAMYEIKKHYKVEKFTEGWDEYVRQYYFGGRVECLRGRGRFVGDYKLYDINSQYPKAMASFQHPIGGFHDYQMRWGPPSNDTVFVNVSCTNNGAFIARDDDGSITSRIKRGTFCTTIWEYEMALKLGLISDVKVHMSIDCAVRTDFSKFVLPLYDNRLRTKSEINRMKKNGDTTSVAYLEMKKDDLFYKLLLNNGYGKFAQNPRNYKEHYVTDAEQSPPEEWFATIDEKLRDQYALPAYECDAYWIWQKPAPGFRFNNVGTAASITGAARAMLMEGLYNAVDPIYCDTDSIICRELSGVEIHKTALGAWDLEKEFVEVIVNGKKLYSPKLKYPEKRTPEEIENGASPDWYVKSKGSSRLTWQDMEHILAGGVVSWRNHAPTLKKTGEQVYLERSIRATTPIYNGE